jgi:hypothetical protein
MRKRLQMKLYKIRHWHISELMRRFNFLIVHHSQALKQNLGKNEEVDKRREALKFCFSKAQSLLNEENLDGAVCLPLANELERHLASGLFNGGDGYPSIRGWLVDVISDLTSRKRKTETNFMDRRFSQQPKKDRYERLDRGKRRAN